MKSLWQSFGFLDRKTLLISLSAIIFPVIYVYHGTLDTHVFSEYIFGDFFIRLVQFSIIFFLFGLLPVLFIKFFLKKPLKDFGLGFGDYRLGIKIVVVAIVVITPFLYIGSLQHDLQKEYPLLRIQHLTMNVFVLYEATYLLYYIGWEFFFRGYMLFGLRDSFGTFGAIVAQTLPSVLLHIGKPEIETWGSIIAGFVFALITLKTRSFLYVLIIHYFIGVLTDLFCALQKGMFL